ncbi:hypothetical protein CXB51_009004 [Gossypium anomalum]|uniref:Reverse transcriptase zinc-binding domain-containing protein n=1 Tax=Gossypium anomalum TaxID=47600 RepID=A0A8J5ZBS8_9ROSI|nr:hypothetical protein CXB51_009004 [Gossypium anomalum]
MVTDLAKYPRMLLFHKRVPQTLFNLLWIKCERLESSEPYQNNIFLLKLGFHILANIEAFRVCILHNKYNMDGLILKSIEHTNCSYVWRPISNVWCEVIEGVVWFVGNGRLINFWNYSWIKELGPLKLYYISRDRIDETLRLCDLVTDHGSWDWQGRKSLLPQSILNQLTRLMPLYDTGGPDTFNNLLGVNILNPQSSCVKVWKIVAPQHVRAFLWLSRRSRLLTNGEDAVGVW